MHISTRLILGGSQENTVLSCEGQLDDGHAVALVYGPIYGPEGSLLERASTHRSPEGRAIELIETPHLVRELSPMHDIRCVRLLRAIIRDWRPDIVHTHSSKAGILGRWAAWRERIPCVVHTIHGLPFHPYERAWRNAIYVASERFAAKRCHRIICVADAMRDQALARGIGSPEQYVTVRSGMEVDRFLNHDTDPGTLRAALRIPDDAFVLGTVARLAELKGHDDLLDSLSRLMTERPALHLLWVGDGWWKERLTNRIESLGLGDRVTLAGLVPSDEVPKYLAAMDCLVHPSYREGLPRTLPQALLSGKPVIAYDVDGASEVCINHETGILVSPGDLDSLRNAVAWMMDHPQQRESYARLGRERCREQFAVRTMVDGLASVYRGVLEHDDEHRPGNDAEHHRRGTGA